MSYHPRVKGMKQLCNEAERGPGAHGEVRLMKLRQVPVTLIAVLTTETPQVYTLFQPRSPRFSLLGKQTR